MVKSCRFGLQVIFHEEGFLSIKTAAITVRTVPKKLIIAAKVTVAGYVIDTFSCNRKAFTSRSDRNFLQNNKRPFDVEEP